MSVLRNDGMIRDLVYRIGSLIKQQTKRKCQLETLQAQLAQARAESMASDDAIGSFHALTGPIKASATLEHLIRFDEALCTRIFMLESTMHVVETQMSHGASRAHMLVEVLKRRRAQLLQQPTLDE